MESNALKWDGHVLRLEYNRWPKRIMMWSQEGSRRGRPEVNVRRATKQRNVTSDDTVKWQLWGLKTGNRWTTAKPIDSLSQWSVIFFLNTEITSKLWAPEWWYTVLNRLISHTLRPVVLVLYLQAFLNNRRLQRNQQNGLLSSWSFFFFGVYTCATHALPTKQYSPLDKQILTKLDFRMLPYNPSITLRLILVRWRRLQPLHLEYKHVFQGDHIWKAALNLNCNRFTDTPQLVLASHLFLV
jgi:hypothetical protein